VLSPSTEGYDRGFKSAHYRTIASLQEYALVSQSEARVEVFLRESDREWHMSEYVGVDTVCYFKTIDLKVSLSNSSTE